MQILDRDDRRLTDVNPINFRARNIVFYDMKITGSYAKAIEEMVKGNFYFVGEDTQKVPFDKQREIFDMGGNSMVIEYKTKEIRDRDIELIKKYFKAKGKFSEELENGRQVPEFDGYFEYNGKYYIIIDGLNKLTDEVSDTVYKGIIINPGKYFKVMNQVNDSNSEVRNVLDTK